MNPILALHTRGKFVDKYALDLNTFEKYQGKKSFRKALIFTEKTDQKFSPAENIYGGIRWKFLAGGLYED